MNLTTQQQNADRKHRATPRGMALLLSIFVVSFAGVMVLGVLDTETLHYTAARHAIDYERALYLANAGVQHACVELQTDAGWRGVVSDGSYPTDGSYTAIASDSFDGTILVTSTGVAGETTRTVEAKITL